MTSIPDKNTSTPAKSFKDQYTNLVVMNHPLIQVKLTELRGYSVGHGRFRALLNEIAGLMVYECTRDLQVSTINVQTPLEKCNGQTLTAPITLVPILRAGLGMTEGILNLMPEAKVGHLGLYRDDKTLQAISYFEKLPTTVADGRVFIVDPMLATGGSAIAAVNRLKNRGCSDISLICLVCAPEGVKALNTAHPDTKIFTASLDRQLSDKGYILPGLGDAGDRIFGTL